MPWATAVALGYWLCRELLALHRATVAFALSGLISVFAMGYCLCPGLLPMHICPGLRLPWPWAAIAFAWAHIAFALGLLHLHSEIACVLGY